MAALGHLETFQKTAAILFHFNYHSNTISLKHKSIHIYNLALDNNHTKQIALIETQMAFFTLTPHCEPNV